jgi:hypothetical protein
MDLEYIEFIENCFRETYSIDLPIEDPQSEKQELNFYKKEIGKILINTGLIGACDGFEIDSYIPFDNLFPKGEFSVELSIVKLQDDERIAFSRIKLSDNKPIKVELAIKSGSEHEKEAFFVDSGTACYFDKSAIIELNQLINKNEEWYSEIEEFMQKSYMDTRSWHLLKLPNNNIPFFTSGQGDGTYKSFIIFDENNEICQLITDFNLFITDEE